MSDIRPGTGGGAAAPDPWRLCVAPMIDWTDRHCRAFHRLISPGVRLYTEMITPRAQRHGDVGRHLDHDASEHPVALQLGGSEPGELAFAARLGQQWGYDEINLNCGCPSERVQRGAFGACLMAEPALVADCVRAMRDAVEVPVTVKHRLGLGKEDSYDFVRDFVGACQDAGCQTVIVHARKAWLQGLSPKENREVPPLRYDVAFRLRGDFPGLRVVLNGGLRDTAAISAALERVDGVMIGRAAYQQPFDLAQWDARFIGSPHLPEDPFTVIEPLSAYLAAQVRQGVPAWPVIRHTLGLMHGRRGARAWRQRLSDPQFVAQHGADALRAAAALVQQPDA